jgi:hypothetical protein
MGASRTRTGNQPAWQAPSPALAGREAERGGQHGRARRGRAVVAYLLAAAVLFVLYLRLSGTYAPNSDSANILLMGQDLLHGNLLLQGWHMSDVSFYPTELFQYALLESFLGLHMQTAHVAAAMTYTLVFLLAVMLARSGSTGRAALVRTLVAGGILLAPQFGLGVFALDLSVGHIGTSVPLLLTWLLLDKAPRAWWVPVLTAVLLTWVQIADSIVYIMGIAPLGLACAVRVARGVATDSGRWRQRLARHWYELSLVAAAAAAAGLAWAVVLIVRALGGYVMSDLPFYFTPWNYLDNNVPALWKTLEIFGANFDGASGIWFALAILHLVSVLTVAWALARVARRYSRVSLVDLVLAVAIVLNVVLYWLTNAADLASHEVAIIVPFGAALAARMLVRPAADRAGALAADRAKPAKARRPSRRIRLVGPSAARRPSRRIRLAGLVAGIAVLAGYTAGLGYEISQPAAAPPPDVILASWLTSHHLTYGLSGYWTSSSVTVDTGNRVQVRAVRADDLNRDLWMAKPGWFDPALHDANFIVLDSQPGNFSHFEPGALIAQYFGTPARTYRFGYFTVLVFDKNLLRYLPG